MNDDMLRERFIAMTKVQEIEAAKALDLKKKSMCRRDLDGDENCSFFHGLVNVNNRRNKIVGLNIDDI